MAVRKKNLIILMFVMTSIIVMPVMGGTLYLSGSPNLSASVSGSNEFSPNSEVQITITIQNTGQSKDKLVQSGITDRDDLPTTAKFLSASLSPGNAPVTIKTDPVMLGDLGGSSSASALYTVKIKESAGGGTYLLPLTLNYSYLSSASQYNDATMEYFYQSEEITLDIPITIKPEAAIEVLSADPEHITAGADGYINVKVKNSGTAHGSQAIVVLTRNGASPIIPVDDSVYIGDFSPGSTAIARYKVSVSDRAERQSYPVDIRVIYLNPEGDSISARQKTLGIPVSGKMSFAIISSPATMHPGNQKEIQVEYKNTGDSPVYGAKARISAVDPFTSTSDIAYIGDLQPNESRVIIFQLGVDRSATIKEYGLDSEIRYRDALDNTHLSDPMKLTVDVTATEGIAIILTNPIYLSIVAAATIGIAYMVYHYRKKKE
ncbi:MAG: S-layer protein [Methanoregula sp.]|nr:MAG: S-layer protein [Methanoregula sp.]